ncbi:VOC family protein [Sphingomonas sp. ASV193]|uniref:VOC family protein n=1 Tax=Sphingomonas sp. ASV193 TaxID=3144405 RepID=UPI0032E86862
MSDHDPDTGSFIWYELMTPDAAAAKAFYDAVVGWDIDPANSIPGGGPVDYRMIKRADGGNAGGLLVLTDDMIAHGARAGWVGYLHVADVDRTVAAVEADGGTTLMPARDMDGVGRLAMLADPWGAPFYVMTPTPPSGNPDAKSDVFSVDRPQHVRWNDLASDDQDGAIAFYRKHFGWTQEGAMPMGEMGDYKFIQKDGVGIGAIMKKLPQHPRNAWTFYIGVDDIDRALAAVKAGGGTPASEPMPIPGGEFSVHATDPQGATFGLVGPRK